MSSCVENNNIFIETVKNNNAQTESSVTYQMDKNNKIMNSNKETSHNLIKKEKTINEVWTKNNFNHRKMNKRELNLNLKATKMSWTNKNNKNDEMEIDGDGNDEKVCTSPTPSTPDKETVTSPSHHARRPMNAFLIFCKKHRPIVRKKYPNLENRGVTRILGEWWAVLDSDDKDSYTKLAKEYKDAFFSANPNFKWYKLPAPPLRTLSTRPLTVQREISPLQSPNESSHTDAQFTPGKLADESQLGKLTSLLKSDSFCNKSVESDNKINVIQNSTDTNFNNNNNINNNNNNNNTKKEFDFSSGNTSPESNVKYDALPPKPLKKRLFEQTDNNKTDFYKNNNMLNLSDYPNNNADASSNGNNTENITKQELYEKVVESMFLDEDDTYDATVNNGTNKLKSKETRKSGRSCKGKRYEEFMINGKLLKNKREKKMGEFNFKIDSKFDNELNHKFDYNYDEDLKRETPKLDLENTIKRLAERTNSKVENNKKIKLENENDVLKLSTNSDNLQNTDFNLELRIAELPFLSYDNFVQRKRDSKKRKQSKGSKAQQNTVKHKGGDLVNNKLPVGSKKRKNKNNITHLDKKDTIDKTVVKNEDEEEEDGKDSFSTDLSGLATLAEIAANKEKINE